MTVRYLLSSPSPSLPAQNPNLRNHRTSELNGPLFLNLCGPSTLFPRTAELIYISITRGTDSLPPPILSKFALFCFGHSECREVFCNTVVSICSSFLNVQHTASSPARHCELIPTQKAQRKHAHSILSIWVVPCPIRSSHKGLMQMMPRPFPRSSLPLPAQDSFLGRPQFSQSDV